MRQRRFFRCTSSRETATGVTPGIRDGLAERDRPLAVQFLADLVGQAVNGCVVQVVGQLEVVGAPAALDLVLLALHVASVADFDLHLVVDLGGEFGVFLRTDDPRTNPLEAGQPGVVHVGTLEQLQGALRFTQAWPGYGRGRRIGRLDQDGPEPLALGGDGLLLGAEEPPAMVVHESQLPA